MKQKRPDPIEQERGANPPPPATELGNQTWRHTPQGVRSDVAAASLQTFLDRAVTVFKGGQK